MMLVDKHTIELTEKINASSKGGLIPEDKFTLFTSSTHYLFTIMNTQKKGTFQFCFPGLLQIHRNPKWKEFLRSRESFLKKVSICTLTDLNPGFGGPWNKLQIILVNGTFIMPQNKSFGQKNFWISCTGSKIHFSNFYIPPKWHFWTRASNSKIFLAKRLLLMHYESTIYKKYP